MGNSGTEKPDDYTIVFFGGSPNKVMMLASLLSDDGQLVIERRNDEVIVVNSANAAWTPDPKYHICNETEPARIAKRLRELTGPFRFVVAFDIFEMFDDRFWETIYYLEDIQASPTFASVDGIQMVAMNIPHDGIPLQQHFDDLKGRINNLLQFQHRFIQSHSAADVRMAGLHEIEKTGPVNEIQDLKDELVTVKNAVGQYLHQSPTDDTLNKIVKVMGNSGTKEPGDFKIVFFGAHFNRAVVLASLLSDDGQLVIERRDGDAFVVTPANATWTLDPKYHLCNETEPRRIAKHLRELTGPFRFVVAFEIGDLFMSDEFSTMFNFLVYYQKTYASVDEIQIVVMDSLRYETKRIIMDDLNYSLYSSVNVRITHMRGIGKAGPVSEMQELKEDLVTLKNAVG